MSNDTLITSFSHILAVYNLDPCLVGVNLKTNGGHSGAIVISDFTCVGENLAYSQNFKTLKGFVNFNTVIPSGKTRLG